MRGYAYCVPANTGPINSGLYESGHPYYCKRFRRWKLNRAAYIGGDEWYGQGDTYQLGPFTIQPATPGKTGHTTGPLRESNRLWRHEREKDPRYFRRLRMAAYENVFGPQINTIAATVAKSCRNVKLPEGMEYLETNTDRWGQDMATARMRRIAWAHVYGHVYTLLEKPAYVPEPSPLAAVTASTESAEYTSAETDEPVGPPSRMHELQAGIRVYACTLSPLDLLDWNWDADAMAFRWALIRVTRPAERVAPDEQAEPVSPCTWTKLYRPGQWVLFKDGVPEESGPAPDVVPIVVQFAVGQDPAEAEPVGIPVNDDVTDIVELRFNKSSWLNDMESAQCFNQAHIKTGDGSALDNDTEQALGVHTYIGAEEFDWVSPSTDPMTHLMNSMDRDAATMRQMGGVETKGETSQAAKSGVALQLEQQNMGSLFAMYAAAAEAGERAIWRMAAMLEGMDPEAVIVEYVRDFSALDASARFGTLTTALTVGQFTGMAKAELQKQIWMAANPEAEHEVRDKVFAEIDAEAARADAARAAQEQAALAATQRLAAGGASTGEDDPEAEDEDAKPAPFGKEAAA